MQRNTTGKICVVKWVAKYLRRSGARWQTWRNELWYISVRARKTEGTTLCVDELQRQRVIPQLCVEMVVEVVTVEGSIEPGADPT